MELRWRELSARTGLGRMIRGAGTRLEIHANRSVLKYAAIFSTGIFSFALSRSLIIALAFATFVAIFNLLARRHSESKLHREILISTPEMIDHIISGIQSGLSLNESLIGLGSRGPVVLRPYFQSFERALKEHGNFIDAINQLKDELAQPNTDLVFESLIISKTLGGAELLRILRLVGNFLREDLALRREISVKLGWIKNSAHLSAAAPWILLLLLSTQPATSRAFSTLPGALVLATGLAMTAVAYLWMNRLGQMPLPHRLFGGEERS